MPRGGQRTGAGRPAGKHPLKQSKVMRVPLELQEDVALFVENKGYKHPLYASRVAAGQPMPADDYVEGYISLNEYLVRHPSGTAFARASGDSMIGAGIHDGDLLVVDRIEEPRHGSIVVAALAGDLTVKRLHVTSQGTFLMPENPKYSPIDVTGRDDMVLLGVVTGAARRF